MDDKQCWHSHCIQVEPSWTEFHILMRKNHYSSHSFFSCSNAYTSEYCCWNSSRTPTTLHIGFREINIVTRWIKLSIQWITANNICNETEIKTATKYDPDFLCAETLDNLRHSNNKHNKNLIEYKMRVWQEKRRCAVIVVSIKLVCCCRIRKKWYAKYGQNGWNILLCLIVYVNLDRLHEV